VVLYRPVDNIRVICSTVAEASNSLIKIDVSDSSDKLSWAEAIYRDSGMIRRPLS